MAVRRVNVEGMGRLRAFCHATICGDQVFVSGTLGVKDGGVELVAGGVGPETSQALSNIERILAACGCTLKDVAKVNVYMSDMSGFEEMNRAYLDLFGSDPPARITVGISALALGAAVEIDCVAFCQVQR
ncbi:MAG: RidA family protein [Acidimicrobiales bacterium]